MLSMLLAASGLVPNSRPGVRAPRRRCGAPRCELGFQVDPAASASSLLVLGSFAALQIKIKQAERYRDERDAAAESYRQAQVALLAGQVDAEEAERSAAVARRAFEAYQQARRVLSLPGAELRIPDPTASKVANVLKELYPPEQLQTQVEMRADQTMNAPTAQPRANADGLDPLRARLGLLRPREDGSEDAVAASDTSLLPTGSSRVTLKDVAIGSALLLQIGWFLLSLTDPMGPPGPALEAVLTAGGDAVDARQAKRAAEDAEYRQMLQDAIDAGEAPACPESGCGGRYIPRMPTSISGPAEAQRD